MIKKVSLILACGGAAIAHWSPAFACSRIGSPGRVVLPAKVVESNARDMLRRVDAVLEVETLSAESSAGPGALRVLRVIKGDYKSGEVLKAYPSGSSMCGPGTIAPGKRGMILLDDKPFSFVKGDKGIVSFPNFLGRNEAAAIRRLAVSEPSLTAPLVFDLAGFRKEAQALRERVRSDPNFAGFIIRELPRPHAVVRFTGDALRHLRRYTTDPRFASQAADLTLTQLEAIRNRTAEALQALGLRCFTADVDEELNQVTVRATEMDKVERAISGGQFVRPQKVQFYPLEACPQSS